MPLFICAEMFLELRDIESRRWTMWALRANLLDAGLPVATLGEFLLPEDIDWLESQSARVAHDWYLGDDGDRTIYRGVSLGRCVEYEVKARAVRLLKLARCIQRLLQRYPDAKVYCDAAECSTEQRVLKQFHIAIHRFGAPEDGAGMHPTDARAWQSVPSVIVAKGRQWGLLAMKLLASGLQTFRHSDSPLVVVRWAPQSLKMLESWMKSRGGPRVRFAIWMDLLGRRPFDLLSLVTAGCLVIRRPLTNPSEHSRDLDRIETQVGELLSMPRLHFHAASGPHLEVLVSDLLRAIATASFPIARIAIDDGYEVFGRMNAALLVTPNDCLLVTRAWTLVANRLGKASLVFQHGHLDYTEDENHRTATHSAFWSTVVAQQFQAAGLQSEQTIVTGSPNADACFKQQQKRQALTRDVASAVRKPRVLIVTTGNPGVQAYIGETWVCDYIAGVLDALSPRFADLSITVKLHPGENEGLYKVHLGERLPPGTRISDRGDLVTMISEADVVISPPSTVVLEARAIGSAVVLLLVPSVNDRKTTLEQADGVITAHGYRDLTATIDTVLAGDRSPHTGMLPLSDFLGPIDGNAARRLLDAVGKLVELPQGARRREPERIERECDAIH